MSSDSLSDDSTDRTCGLCAMREESRESLGEGGAEEPFVMPKRGELAITNLHQREGAIARQLDCNQPVQKGAIHGGGVVKVPVFPRKQGWFSAHKTINKQIIIYSHVHMS